MTLAPWILVLLAAGLAAACTAVLIPLAPRLGLVDVPGGRKTHGGSVALVGGLAAFLAIAGGIAIARAGEALVYLAAMSLVVAVGVRDDARDLRPRYKFLAQVGAGVIMVVAGEVVIRTLGDLVGWKPLWMSLWTAVPLTVFAVVGVVNSINMIDGLDGLAGSIAAVALAWFGIVAWEGDFPASTAIAACACGATLGFLAFNLRLGRRTQAQVFLGDAGSLALGFTLAWLAVDLTQGPRRSLPPIAALWFVVLPLADCVSLMTRRVLARRNPFVADREHIHHYLLARGFSVNATVAILVALSAAFGAVGYVGWKLRVPEWMLFWPFFFGYFAYHAWIQRAWRKLRP